MSESEREDSQASSPVDLPDRSLMKGLVAGVVAGLAATAAISAVERLFSPSGPESAARAAEMEETTSGEGLETKTRDWARRWLVGAAAGAAYGALVEFSPEATERQGAIFGLVLMVLGDEHESEAAEDLEAEPIGRGVSGSGSPDGSWSVSRSAGRMAFGLVAERTRRAVRRML
ncbi:MAG: hypothetical protein ACP5E5_03790 [Acidobacteriaceae bacterium]